MAKKSAEPELEIGTDGFVEEFCTKPYVDDDGVQVSSGIGRDGKEYPDPVPMSPPVGYAAPPDLMQMIRTMVHHEVLQSHADADGFDTFEEAGDFDIPDEIPDPISPYEALLMPLPEGNRPQEAAPVVPPVSDATSPPKVAAPSEAGVASPPPGPLPDPK